MTKVIDISVPLRRGMPTYPGDVPYDLEPVARLEDGDPSNLSKITTGTHAGTHIDAPAHFLPEGATVDQLPLEVLIGPAWVASFSEEALFGDARSGSVTGGMSRHFGPHIIAEHLEAANIPEGTERLLLKTPNSKLWMARPNTFAEDYVAILPDAAEWMVERGIRLVGIDCLSIERFGNPPEAHEILLRAGVVVVEGLDLTEPAEGAYELCCLPLRLVGAEGAPARAVLLRRTSAGKG